MLLIFLLSNRNSRKLFVNSGRVFRQGTLEDLLRNNGPLEQPLVVKFTRQLLSAVDYLHTNGKKHIVHKDIKGEVWKVVASCTQAWVVEGFYLNGGFVQRFPIFPWWRKLEHRQATYCTFPAAFLIKFYDLPLRRCSRSIPTFIFIFANNIRRNIESVCCKRAYVPFKMRKC